MRQNKGATCRSHKQNKYTNQKDTNETTNWVSKNAHLNFEHPKRATERTDMNKSTKLNLFAVRGRPQETSVPNGESSSGSQCTTTLQNLGCSSRPFCTCHTSLCIFMLDESTGVQTCFVQGLLRRRKKCKSSKISWPSRQHQFFCCVHTA